MTYTNPLMHIPEVTQLDVRSLPVYTIAWCNIARYEDVVDREVRQAAKKERIIAVRDVYPRGEYGILIVFVDVTPPKTYDEPGWTETRCPHGVARGKQQYCPECGFEPD